MQCGFGFSVGDVILLSQLSWKTWQACTSGRKAAPGEFAVVESELWTLSSALEQLATLWSAEVDNITLVKEFEGLQTVVQHCEANIKELNVFLDKYRPACASPAADVQWTTRAKMNWRKIMWVTHKNSLEGFRSKIDSHTRTLNTLINISERHSLRRLEEKINNLVVDSKMAQDIATNGEIITTPPPPFPQSPQSTEELWQGLGLQVHDNAGYFDRSITDAFDLWLNNISAYTQHYSFSFSHRKDLSNNLSEAEYLSKVGSMEFSKELVGLAMGLFGWLRPPLTIENMGEYAEMYHTMLSVAFTTIEVMSLCFSPLAADLTEDISTLIHRFKPQRFEPEISSNAKSYRVGFLYLQFLTEMVKQFSAIITVAQRSHLRIYPPDMRGSFIQQSLADNIQRLYLESNEQNAVDINAEKLMVDEPLRPSDVQFRYKQTLAVAFQRPTKVTDTSSAVQGLRSWLQPPEEVDEERTLQSSRHWPSTCSWIFEKSSYQKWFSSKSSSILWFHARPGAGKSVLASHLIQLLDNAEETSAYFCFRYNDDILRSPQSLLRSFAFQIAQNHPTACSALLRLRDEGITIATARIGTVWKKLFLDTLLKHPFEMPIYLVIDALDEAEASERLPFINFLSDISKSSNNFKIVIFSRYIRDIATKFSQMPIPVEEITPDDNADDICLVAKERLQRSTNLGELSAEILPKLTSQSNGSFIWVTKTLDALDARDSKEDILHALEELPAGMDELYNRILDNMARGTDSQVKFGQTILRWVLCAVRPLLLPEMSFVVQTLHGDVPNVHTLIRNTCGQLVSVDKSQRVQANHLTIYEYLTKPDARSEFRIDLPSAHEDAALFCLDCLVDLGQLDGLSSEEIVEQGDFVEYAITFWSHHVAKSPPSSELLGMVVSFLDSESFLGWIQALAKLSILKYLETTMTNLNTWAQNDGASGLCQHLERLKKMAFQLGYATKIYNGALLGEKKHGFGTCKYANNEYYEGNFENDLRHGFGQCEYADGQKYIGWWQRDEYYGQGTLESADGCKYVGEWVAGRKQGYGIMTWTWMERVSYSGTWKDDRPHGTGTILFFLGSRYDGEWYEGCEQGFGKTMYWQGNHFEGEFKGGYEVGEIQKGHPESIEPLDDGPNSTKRAKLHFASGGVYEGEINNDGMPHGQGVLVAATGIVYTGAFHEGFFHGAGVARRPNGGLMRGSWTRSVAVGRFEDINDKPGGGRYYGDFADTSRHGQGVLESASGFVYEGAFRYNEMHGQGVRRYTDGSVYAGGLAHGSIHGHGKMVYASSAVYDGAWNNNKQHGAGALTFPEGHTFTGVWAGGLATGGQFVFAYQDGMERVELEA